MLSQITKAIVIVFFMGQLFQVHDLFAMKRTFENINKITDSDEEDQFQESDSDKENKIEKNEFEPKNKMRLIIKRIMKRNFEKMNEITTSDKENQSKGSDSDEENKIEKNEFEPKSKKIVSSKQVHQISELQCEIFKLQYEIFRLKQMLQNKNNQLSQEIALKLYANICKLNWNKQRLEQLNKSST